MAAAETAVCSICELHAEAVFRVEGMDCNEEVVILERRLKPLAGLEAVSADLIGQRLHVKYDAAKLTTDAMVDAVGQTGMRMWLEHEEPAAYGADVNRRSRLVLACALLVGAGLAVEAAAQPVAAAVLFVLATIVGAISPIAARRRRRSARARSTSTS